MRAIISYIVLLGMSISLSACGKEEEPPTAQAVAVTSPSGVRMMLLPGGQFTMGTDADDEGPAHQVTVSPLVIDVYEVYQEQYAKLKLPNSAHFKDPKRPIEMVRWSDAVAFCNERSIADGLKPCYDLDTFVCDFQASGYRLPTEAEWEYAARAGTATVYHFGDNASQLNAYATFKDNAKNKTDLIGRKRPNPWGLCDMYGNVLEWCNDFYQPGYGATANAVDPLGPPEGKNKVLRGGSWNSAPERCRSSTRGSDNPGTSDACFAKDTYGFRCVRRPTREELAKLDSGKTDSAGR